MDKPFIIAIDENAEHRASLQQALVAIPLDVVSWGFQPWRNTTPQQTPQLTTYSRYAYATLGTIDQRGGWKDLCHGGVWARVRTGGDRGSL